MAAILDGITVLDLSSGGAAALATMFLSDQGARVIRVAGPGAPVIRDGGFVIWDRGKTAVHLDLDAAATGDANQIRALDRLVAAADVLIEDFAPSSPRQRLVVTDRLRALNPRLVSCSITAYGKAGPMKDAPAIDDLVLAYSGVLGGMPGWRPAPVHVVHPLPSVGAALFACIGVAASLLARLTTGRGRAVSTSLLAGALLYHPKVVGERIKRHVFQTHPGGSAPFYSNYQCADGRYVQLGCVHVNFIAIAAKLMGLKHMLEEDRFDKGRGGKTPADDAEIRAAIAQVIRTRPYPEWERAFEDADVPFAPARLTEEGMTDAQVLHNGMVVTLDDPALGPVRQMGVPIRFSATPGGVQGPRPDAATDIASLALTAGEPEGATASDTTDAPPLAGIRILEITNLIAGPTGGRLLADLGADVIKLEPHEGDMSRPIGRTYFYSVNFNKRSVSIDTRTEAGKTAVQRIAASADALLANLRPGATQRMGIGPAINPTLIETHLTGYGLTGPYSHRPGIDPLAQALMGLQRAQGGPDNPPVFPAQLAPTDYTTGAMGALGTILALYHRKRTGVVQRVDSDLLSGGIVLSSPWFAEYRGKPVRPLADKEQYGTGPFHRLYRLSDGWIYVAARTEAEESAICSLAGLSGSDRTALDAQGKGARHPNETPLARKLADAFAPMRMSDVLTRLDAAGVACSRANAGDSEVFLEDPHAVANDHVAVRQHPTAGQITVAWQYIQFARTEPTAGRPTPLLGQHTDEVLSEVGYTDSELRSLARADVTKIERA